MAYARPFVKVNIQGHFGASTPPGFEQWQAGFHVSSIGGGSFDPANLLQFLTSIATPVQTYHTAALTLAGTSCYLDTLTAAYVGTDGKYVLGALQPTTVYTYGAPVAGLGTSSNPTATANCITLRSLRLRGPASHGRLYWPALSLTVPGATGIQSSASTLTMATNAQTLFNSINTVAVARFGTGSYVCLVSQGGKSGVPVEAIVTSVGIGSKADHMESRERNLLEAHSYKTLTVSTALLEDRDKQLRDGYEDLDDEDEPSSV